MTTRTRRLPTLLPALLASLVATAPLAAQLTDPNIRFGTRIVDFTDRDGSGGITDGDRVELETWLRRDVGADFFAGSLSIRLPSTVGFSIDETSWDELVATGLTRTSCDCPEDAPGNWTFGFTATQPTEFRVRWEVEVTGALPPIVTTRWTSSIGYLKNRVIFLGNTEAAPEGWIDEFAWGDWLAARVAQVLTAWDAELGAALGRYVLLRDDAGASAGTVDVRRSALGETVELVTDFLVPPTEPAGFASAVELQTILRNTAAAGERTLTLDLVDFATAGFTVDPGSFEVTALAGEILETPAETGDLGRFVVRLPAGGSVTIRWRGLTAAYDAAIFTPVVTVRLSDATGAVNQVIYPKAVIQEVPAAVAAADQLLSRAAQVLPLSDAPLVQSMLSYLTVRGYQRQEPSDIGYDADGNGN